MASAKKIYNKQSKLIKGAYIRDVNWVTYMGGVNSGGLYTGDVLTGIYGIAKDFH